MDKNGDLVIKYLSEQFGVREEDINFKLVEKENGKIYAYGWNCEKIGIKKHRFFDGIYFGKLCKDGVRLSIEGSFLIGKVAKKGIIDLDEEEAIRWLSGENLEREEKGYVILKWRSYFLGCGKGDGKFIKNYIPKDRRLSHGDKGVSENDG